MARNGYPTIPSAVPVWPGQQPVLSIAGRYTDPRIQGDEVTILQAGDALTITNPKQAWSPANGRIDAQNNLTFTAGGLTHLTASFNPATRVISISNNTQWCALPEPANIAGKFTDPRIQGDEVTITQAGDALTITNPKQAWSPAHGRIDVQNNLTFTAGGLTHLTATFNPATRVISISNNTQWCALPEVSVANIAGKFTDPRIQGDEVTILQAGDALTITNPKQAWSPAHGRIDVQNRLTFTSGGLTHLTATFNPATRVISISNNTEWCAVPEPANIAGKFTDPRIQGDEVTITQAGDALTITNPKHRWSPANGRIDAQNKIAFTAGGLKRLTATFNPATGVISLSNNTHWRAMPSAPVAYIAGKFTDRRLRGDEVTIVQAGDALLITNPTTDWSPAQGKIDAQNKITFTAGGLTHLTATFTTKSRLISLSNRTQWHAVSGDSVAYIAGKFTDPSIYGDEVTITQAGDALTITNPKQSWSPASGKIDAQNNLTFTSGGLTHLTASFNPATRVISISNNTQWCDLPSAAAPSIQNVPSIAGKFGDPRIQGDEVTIVQAADSLFLTNPKHSWSPAEGRIDQHNRITFTSGGLTHLTATFNPATRDISLSNNSTWRALPGPALAYIAGKFTDPALRGDEVTIVQAGEALTITNPKQAWSPAQGRLDAQNRLTFTSGGLTHLTATFNPATRVISISNNTEWRAVPGCRHPCNKEAAQVVGKMVAGAIGKMFHK